MTGPRNLTTVAGPGRPAEPGGSWAAPPDAADHGVVVWLDRADEPSAAPAVAWAARYAAHHALPLRLMRVLPRVHQADRPAVGSGAADPAQAAAKQLARRADEVRLRHRGLHVDGEVAYGDEAAAVAAAARSAHLLVTAERQYLALMAPRAVDARVHCPVVVVRGGAEAAAGPGEVVLVTDGPPPRRAAQFAFRVAADLGAPLHAVSRHRPAIAYGADYWIAPEWPERDEAALALALDAAHTAYPAVPLTLTRAQYGFDDPVADVSRAARLVVVGADSGEPGGAVRTLVHDAACPVAVVPAF